MIYNIGNCMTNLLVALGSKEKIVSKRALDKMPLPVILKFDGKFTKIKHIKVFQPPLDGWWKERMVQE